MNEQAKVGSKLKLRLWDQACKRSIESRVEKGAVMIVHVLSGWLASSYPIRSVFLQHISWNTIIKREFLPFRMKEWLNWCMDACSSYKYGSNIGLERLIKKYFCQHHNITIIIKGESETCPISEIAIMTIIIFSLKFIGLFEAAASSFTNLFFPPSRFRSLSSGHSLCCLPHFAPTASRKKRVAKFSVLWAQCETPGLNWRLRA